MNALNSSTQDGTGGKAMMAPFIGFDNVAIPA
jgi:hypothetical protein